MKNLKKLGSVAIPMLFAVVLMAASGCDQRSPSSDTIQQDAQERVLKEGTMAVGMPGITNFRERKLLKDILELRDQGDFVTYTYMENMMPQVTPGITALGGKLTYFGETIGYPLPYATQFTNPQKVVDAFPNLSGYNPEVIPQADPNGLFSPASAEATWVLLKDPNGDAVKPIYCEPRLVCMPFKLPAD